MVKTRNGITKIEGVRRAVQELGQEATTDAIQGFLKDRFGIVMTKQHLYVAKRQALREAKGKTTPSKKRSGKASTFQARSQVQSANGNNGKGSVALEDIRTVKGLVDRFGASKVHSLIGLFAK